MSTKIYGWRWTPGDTPNPLELGRLLTTHLRDHLEWQWHRAVISRAIELYDTTPGAHPYIDAERLLNEQATTARADGRIPAGRVRIYICDNPNTPNSLYLLPCGDDIDQILADVPGLEYWPYWDNTDRPDDVSETEWTERRDTWARVFTTADGREWATAGEVGLAWDSPDPSWGLTTLDNEQKHRRDELVAELSDPLRRGRDAHIRNRVSELFTNTDNVNGSGIMRVVTDARDETDEHVKLAEQYQTLSWADLTSPAPDAGQPRTAGPTSL